MKFHLKQYLLPTHGGNQLKVLSSELLFCSHAKVLNQLSQLITQVLIGSSATENCSFHFPRKSLSSPWVPRGLEKRPTCIKDKSLGFLFLLYLPCLIPQSCLYNQINVLLDETQKCSAKKKV